MRNENFSANVQLRLNVLESAFQDKNLFEEYKDTCQEIINLFNNKEFIFWSKTDIKLISYNEPSWFYKKTFKPFEILVVFSKNPFIFRLSTAETVNICKFFTNTFKGIEKRIASVMDALYYIVQFEESHAKIPMFNRPGFYEFLLSNTSVYKISLDDKIKIKTLNFIIKKIDREFDNSYVFLNDRLGELKT